MNDAHLHIAINHFPIIGIVFGLGILIAGLLLKNNTVKNTAYVVFMVSAIFGGLSVFTGEGAEEIVEKLPNITDEMIHEHHEIAEKFAVLAYLTGLFALVSLYSTIKGKAFAKYTSIITMVLGLTATYLAKDTATTGGELRHTEIKKDFVVPASNDHHDHESHGHQD